MWTVTDTVTQQQVSFAPISGDLEMKTEQPTGVFYPLQSAEPIVLRGVTRYASMVTPEWLVTGNGAWAVMKSVLESGNKLVIVTDLGESYPCRVIGGWTVKVEDTPNRAAAARRLVTVQLLGTP